MNNTCMDELTGFWEPGLLSALKGHGVEPQPRVECPQRPRRNPCNQGQVSCYLSTTWLRATAIESCVTQKPQHLGQPREAGTGGASSGRTQNGTSGALVQRRVSAGRPPTSSQPGAGAPPPRLRRLPACPPGASTASARQRVLRARGQPAVRV